MIDFYEKNHDFYQPYLKYIYSASNPGRVCVDTKFGLAIASLQNLLLNLQSFGPCKP